jgi:sigma-B regulation protein RsbU (phosphoserine phosphatase)
VTGLPGGPEAPFRHTLPSGLLHDLRTPLNQIIGYSELLVEQMEDAGQDDFVPYLQKVRAAGHQLLSLIEDNFLSAGRTVEPEPAVGAVPEWHAGAPTEGLEWGSVLVVDDQAADRDVLSQRLRREGYDVVVAEDGRQALELLAAGAFDLVLLDIVMPGMDGYEILRQIKSDDRLRNIPVIMITALSEMGSVARSIEMGAEDYLPKPFDPVLLKARIGACLERKRARDREILLFEELQENHRRLQELEHLRR